MQEPALGLNLSPFEDHLSAPRGRGRLRHAPHFGEAGGAACGDSIRIALRVEGESVLDAGFDARGCAAARAAGSAAVELVKGARLLDAARIAPRDIAAALAGLSAERRHAAELAADALHTAIGKACADGAPALTPAARRTLVAMSGGVDSAVAAELAKRRGDEVVAVTLELWSDPANDGAKSCCSPQAVRGARGLAHRMGLPHVTLDLRDRFGAQVVDHFVSEHAAGATPNPCTRCNGLVRFGAMLELAQRLGAGRLATGHYARIARDKSGPLLRAAADTRKDQAYMLARLAPSDLERLDFPLGELTKPEVRALARAAGLPVAERPESQDLCFLAGTDGARFLRRHGRLHPRRGEIVDLRGHVLGEHAGQHLFTVGQRRGLGVSASSPLYVVRKEPDRERVVVAPRAALATRRVELAGAVLHRSGGCVDRVKLRYRSEPVGCRVEGDPEAGRHARLSVELEDAVDGVAPGQLACLMSGELVAGFATIRPGAGTPSGERRGAGRERVLARG
ncbi:MAG: tRNA 2-thiouridine(34) synthase MnmA [Actinobacteria bacterium]|nr:tRNA 2-thiouridine(34) synthase MnmA [Actinomycetota bacterium]